MSSSPRARRLAASVRRALLQADNSVVRGACLACAQVGMRVLAAYLRLGLRAGIYARGGFGFGQPVVGLSDIDLVAVVGDRDGTHDGSRLLSRWRRLERTVPGLRRAVDLACYWQPELEELRWTRFTYGLDGRWPRSLLFPDSPRSWTQPAHDSLPLLLPDLWPLDCWRRISGPDLRPHSTDAAPAHPHLLAWVHLQHWCRLGLRVPTAPAAPWATYACVKLVAEPAKILLWLEHQERYLARREVLERALEVLPEEEPTIAFALALLDDLGALRAPPIEIVWPCFMRLAARIAQRLRAQMESSGATTVRLEGAAPTGSGDQAGAWPLGDWTALAWPPGREESFTAGSGSAGDLRDVLAAAEHSTPTRFVTLLHEGLIVRPGRRGREWFRSLDFEGTDPVSAAMMGGRSVAAFPNVAGWSAAHTAARAVAEHAAWLQLPRDRAVERSRAEHLAGVFSAARAALFLHSLHDGDAVLTVSFEATARALADRLPSCRSVIEDAYDSYRAAGGGGREVPRDVLRAAVRALEELGDYGIPFPHLFSLQRLPVAAGEGVAGTDNGMSGRAKAVDSPRAPEVGGA